MNEVKVEKLNLPVEGMTCASCVSRVEKAISKIDGIKNVSVNLATEKASFEIDSDKVDLKTVAKQVEDAGYKLDLSIAENKSALDKKTTEDKNEYQEELKKDFLIALIFSIPVLIINMGMMWNDFFLNKLLTIDQINKVLFLLTTPIMFIPGKRFFKIFINNLKHFTADMNSLVAIGTGAAYVFSAFVTLFPELILNEGIQPHVYYDTAAVIITLILFGRFLESRAKSKTGFAIKKLLELQPNTAIVVENRKEVEKKIEELNPGNIVLIKPGSKIATDGIIKNGFSTVDESMITGESIPVEKAEGSKVVGGTINLSGSFEYEVTKTGKDSVLGQIIKLVEEAQGSKAPIQKLADKIASVFVPVVILLAIFTFIIWMITGGENSFNPALINFIAVLIIACPCALGLATPTALIVGMGKGAEIGSLIKDGEALELLDKIDTIIFDKTGTVTTGKTEISEIKTFEIDEKEFIGLLASLESRSEHPLANAIINYVKKIPDFKFSEVKNFKASFGKGIEGEVEGKKVIAGTKNFLISRSVNGIEKALNGDNDLPGSVVFVGIENVLRGIVIISDQMKDNSKSVIEELKSLKINSVLLSGDHNFATKKVAEKIGIKDYVSEVLPDGKSGVVAKYKSKGIVGFVGDGINDAPALAASDVGIAIGTGTDVAIESADVILSKGDLGGIVKTIRLSKFTMRTIKQNLFWAFIYNIIGIPLAAFGLLNPMFAAFAMAFSSVSVVSNSLRLKTKRI